MSQIAGSILIVGAALVHIMEQDSLREAISLQQLNIGIRTAAQTVARVDGGPIMTVGPVSSPATRYFVGGLLAVGIVLLVLGVVMDLRRPKTPAA
jgi:hypothetical protein